MDPLIGLGLTIFFAALRYLIPSTPRLVAVTGIAIGVLTLLTSQLPDNYKPSLIVIALVGAGLISIAIGAHIYQNDLSLKRPLPVPESSGPSTRSDGGDGGSAKVVGSGIAIGGPGGMGGSFGIGGAGGSAEVYGDGLAAGGAGGHAGEHGVWRPPAKSGYEIAQRKLGLPVDPFLRQFGRGGAGPGYGEKLDIIEKLRELYFSDKKINLVSIFADINAVPLEYLNGKLAQNSENWRARIVDDEYEFYLLR